MNGTLDFDPLRMTREQSRAFSSELVDLLSERSETSSKTAALSMTNYLKPINHEASFVPKIMEPEPFNEAERHFSTEHNQPMQLIDIEPDSAGVQVVDFGNLAETFTPAGKRVAVTVQQVGTQRVIMNTIELGGFRYNFRTVLTDLLALRLAFYRDKRFLNATTKCLSPTNTPLAYTGKVNNVAVGAIWDYHTWQRSFNTMRLTPNALEPASALFSHGMIALIKSQLVKDVPGTAIVERIFESGLAELKMDGDNINMIVTNKTTLVPTGRFYQYAEQSRLGKYIQFQEPTMLVENRGTRVSMELMEILGIAFINQAGVSSHLYTLS